MLNSAITNNTAATRVQNVCFVLSHTQDTKRIKMPGFNRL